MSRKFLVTVVLILFLLPFVSWYYLNSGLKWRRQAQEYMNGTIPFPEGSYTDRTGRTYDTEIFGQHVSLVTFLPCHPGQEQLQVLDQIYDQFLESGKANFVLLDTCHRSLSVDEDTLRKNWYVIPCNDTIPWCQTLKSAWPSGKKFALVDRNGIIRSYYPVQTAEEKKLLLEHMALLLPRDRQEKVELKRGEKK